MKLFARFGKSVGCAVLSLVTGLFISHGLSLVFYFSRAGHKIALIEEHLLDWGVAMC